MNEEISLKLPTQNLSIPHRANTMLTISVFAVGILYYCFAYLLRVYPSVMEHELSLRFLVNADGLGLLTSLYYFAYAPMQIPVGMLVDRLGVRHSLLTACLVATCGSFLFAKFDAYSVALLGRFLIGMGAAFAYVSALKIASTWLPQRYFATATGFVTGGGMLAAIATDISLTQMIEHTGFDTALFVPVIAGIVLMFLIFIFVKDKTNEHEAQNEESHALTLAELKNYVSHLMANSQMWLIGIVGALLYLPATVFLDIWAIPYLKTAHSLSPQMAANGVSVMLGGWILSSFSTGALSDFFGSRKIPLLLATISATVIASLILYLPELSTSLLFVLLFLFGVCCGPHPLCFTMSKENNDHHISGTAVAFANFLIMMGGFIFQPAVGKLLDFFWNGTVQQGIHIYSSSDFTKALTLMPIGLLIASLLVLTLKETYESRILRD